MAAQSNRVDQAGVKAAFDRELFLSYSNQFFSIQSDLKHQVELLQQDVRDFEEKLNK